MTHARLHSYTGSLTILVVILALLNWNVAPHSAKSWIAALIAMPIIWLISSVMMKCLTRLRLSDVDRKFFTSAVILAGSLIAFSLAAKLVGHVMEIDAELIKRTREVFLGFVILYLFNMMPKLIGASLNGKCSSTAANSMRRFSGLILVLGALGYIGAWIFAPFSQASLFAQWSVGGAVALVAGYILCVFIAERRTRA